MNIDEITMKFAAELSDFQKKHGTINGGFATGLLRKYATEAYNQAVRDAANLASESEYVECGFLHVEKEAILKLLK